MKKQFLFLFTLVLMCVSVPSIRAQGTAMAVEAKQITAADAAKKYPLPAGKKTYPEGIRAEGSEKDGFYRSPYDSKVFDCRKIGSGGLVVDIYANKVFVRP
jgi:hypothetical protein